MSSLHSSPLTRPTSDDVLRDIDLTGRRALVTGGSSGLGVEIARALASAGAEVTLAVRDVFAGEAAADSIYATAQQTRPSVLRLDLMSPASITALTDGWSGPLDILMANAGVMVPPETRTADGWESQFMTNYLGHFALITRLHRVLAEADDARVVLASSNAHLLGPVDIDALSDRDRPYNPWVSYAESKTALILFAQEAQRRWAGDGITTTAYNPGFIRTRLQRNMPEGYVVSSDSSISTAEGAATPVHLAASPLEAIQGGAYYENLEVAAPAIDEERDMTRPETFRGLAPFAADPTAAANLWAFAEQITGAW
jgi:NAD(P)-dependent dehydrogenase (short-subunit alcohol dehydrogenase family)